MSMVTLMLASMAGLMLTPATATEDRVVETRQAVNYASEQLLTDDGVRQVRLQIASTARDVCYDRASRFTRFSRETRQCIQSAYEDGLEQLEVKVAEARNTSRSYAQAVVNAEESAQ